MSNGNEAEFDLHCTIPVSPQALLEASTSGPFWMQGLNHETAVQYDNNPPLDD